MSARILIVEDDENMARVLQLNLRDSGYEILVAYDGLSGLETFREQQPDLVMLDVVLPDMNGHEVCSRIRDESHIPVLMMSATAVNEDDIAYGLEIGADEYMLKPLGEIELGARLKALLRRAQRYGQQDDAIMRYEDDYLKVDLAARRILVNNHSIRLTPTEFKLLAVFIQNQGEVLTFQYLLEQVWGPEYQTENHYPRIYVSHLRRKLEPNYQKPTYIHNEYGVGYRFVPPRPDVAEDGAAART